MHYVPVINFSVMLGDFLSLRVDLPEDHKYLAQGRNAVPLVSLEPATIRSQV